jgi:CelD/BcsL family acetyltransferase involved in cellulose biosynthesis
MQSPLRTLSTASLLGEASRFDAMVAGQTGVDRFCSSTAWIIPAWRAFTPQHTPRIVAGDGWYAALAEATSPGGERIWCPLEAMWLLSTPLIGEPRVAGPAFAALAEADPSWNSLWLSGMRKGEGVLPALAAGLRRHTLLVGPATERHVVDLRGDVGAWMARRSPGFRKKARQGLRRAFAAGLQIETFDPGVQRSEDEAAALYARILAVEARSWKGMAGSGFIDGGMRAFYGEMVPLLAARGQLVATVATLGGEDVAFLFGGLIAGRFRGLQMSFDDRHRELELGNAMQLLTLERLAERGVETYDLGSDMPYKARWSDRIFDTFTLIVRRR